MADRCVDGDVESIWVLVVPDLLAVCLHALLLWALWAVV